MNKNKLILINGAPQVGKDTMGDYIINNVITLIVKYKMTTPLDKIFREIFPQLSDEEFYMYRETKKDITQDIFKGKSLRQIYIELSENVIKPLFGKDYFGKYASHILNNNPVDTVITDCGFNYEIEALLSSINKDAWDIHTFTILRPGYNYSGDSREPINFKKLNVHSHNNVYNNSTLEAYLHTIQGLLKDIEYS